MKVLVTGSAGFIGFHLCKMLIKNNHEVLGIDNINNYYDVNLKKKRILELKEYSKKKKNFVFKKIDITNSSKLNSIKEKFDFVVHLAAQAGVRYSLKYPRQYINVNINGFFNVLELAKDRKIKKFLYASTSSVYGNNSDLPSSESQKVDKPLQIYAATKGANELMAHSYSSLYKLCSVGLRFFTVYGPSSRPDMSLLKFANCIMKGKEIEIYNYGNHSRDFTYVEDITTAIIKILQLKTSKFNKLAPHNIYNIGSNKPVKLMVFIKKIEKYLGRKAKKKFLKLQKGDIINTYADSSKLYKDINFKPQTSVDKGIKNFCDWFLKNYK